MLDWKQISVWTGSWDGVEMFWCAYYTCFFYIEWQWCHVNYIKFVFSTSLSLSLPPLFILAHICFLVVILWAVNNCANKHARVQSIEKKELVLQNFKQTFCCFVIVVVNVTKMVISNLKLRRNKHIHTHTHTNRSWDAKQLCSLFWKFFDSNDCSGWCTFWAGEYSFGETDKLKIHYRI